MGALRIGPVFVHSAATLAHQSANLEKSTSFRKPDARDAQRDLY
jgi:hypothetical protein